MNFTEIQVSAFFAASRDANPLHRDAQYSRRTQFGRPVVYGMAAVLYVLGRWSGGRSFQLKTLRAEFRKPLFLGESYEVKSAESGGAQWIRISKGTVDYAVVSFTADDWTHNAAVGTSRGVTGFAARDSAAENPQTESRRMAYSIAPNSTPMLNEAFGIGASSMPTRQIAALLWASYHVGMEMPGRQALFSELKMEFTGSTTDNADIELDLNKAVFDERFNRYSVTGTGTGIKSLTITAYRRPVPLDFPLPGLPRFAAGDPPLAAKIVFISGAARGFGAVLARVCHLAGATLALNYRGDSRAVIDLRDEIRAAGGNAHAFEGHLDEADSMRAMAQAIAASLGALDVIVNNAAPPIRELQFLEQSNADVLAFCKQNLAITLETARHLMPLLRDGGRFLHISTHYLTSPVRGFSHYLAAKGAQEGLVRGLAEEFRKTEFVVARLPRILTDQTNLPFYFEPPADPGKIAHDLILALSTHTEGNFRLLEMNQ